MQIAMKSVKDCCPAKVLRMGVCGLLTGGLSLAEGRDPSFIKMNQTRPQVADAGRGECEATGAVHG